MNTGLAVPDVEGWAEIWVRTAQAKAAVPAGTPADAAPEQQGWQRFRFQVPLYPHSIYRLTELPDGRLFGTAGAYEGNFVYDPKTGQVKHLGKIQLEPLRHGGVRRQGLHERLSQFAAVRLRPSASRGPPARSSTTA